jgi:hypothetical protein
MRDVVLNEGRRLLIIEDADINARTDMIHLKRVENIIESSRAFYDAIIVLSSTKRGKAALPRWMRGLPLHSRIGRFGHSFWVMEKDLEGRWIQ